MVAGADRAATVFDMTSEEVETRLMSRCLVATEYFQEEERLLGPTHLAVLIDVDLNEEHALK